MILGAIPGFGGSKTQASTAYWQSSEIGFVAYAIADDGAADDVTIKVRNNQKETITITNIRLDDIDVYTTDFVLGPGETKLLSIANGTDICSSAGDAFTLDVNITYANAETGQSYTFLGGGNKLEGTCADRAINKFKYK